MKKSVGLIVMVNMPVNGNYVLMAVLQRRGQWNTEKMAPESYPGCCQVTTHGKVEGKEIYLKALFRECCEKLGMSFSNFVWDNLRIEDLITKTEGDKKVMTFGVIAPFTTLRAIRLGPDSGGLEFISRNQVQDIFILAPDRKKLKEKGPVRRDALYMFPDEIEVVKKAFEIFGKT